MEGEEMERERRWKVETGFEYSTSSGAICIQIIEKLLILLIFMCVRAEYKKRECGGCILKKIPFN